MPRQVNRLPGLKQLKTGMWQARVYHERGEESKNFARQDEALRWQRNLKSELELSASGVRRSDRKWLASLITPSGVVSKSFDEVTAANKWLAKSAILVEEGRYSDSETKKLQFGEYVEIWRKSKVGISGKTLATYKSQLKLHLLPSFGEKMLSSISTADIKTWVGDLNSQGRGRTTIKQSYRLLHQILEAALEEERVFRNPAVGIKLPRIHSSKKYGLTREQLHALSRECGKYSTLVIFMGMCGLRINEALALRAGHFNLELQRVEVKHSWTTDEHGRKLRDADGEFAPGSTKTGEERVVHLPDELIDLLRPLLAHKKDKDWVFTGASGEALDYGYFRRAYFKPAVDRLGLKNVTTHTLRHTCASLLIKLGAPITTVSYILGHASVKMTLDIYGHYYEDDTAIWMGKLGRHIKGSSA